MREKPYQVIDLMTNETVGWFTYAESTAYMTGGYDVIYRPGRKTRKKREFPYNG